MDKFRFFTEIAWPFLLQAGQGQHKFNSTRLIETGIIALVTAGITSYASVKAMDEKFIGMDQRLTSHEAAMLRSQATLEAIAIEQARRTSAILYIEKMRDQHK